MSPPWLNKVTIPYHTKALVYEEDKDYERYLTNYDEFISYENTKLYNSF